MKVIFLDFDGVLNSHRTATALTAHPDKNMCRMDWEELDVTAVNLVRSLCYEAGAKIVVSSTWRLNNDTADFNAAFHKFFDWDEDLVIDTTPEMQGQRGGEIQFWLDHHPEVTHHVILDDDSDMNFDQNFIKINNYEGMLFRDYICALFYLDPENEHFTRKNSEWVRHMHNWMR